MGSKMYLSKRLILVAGVDEAGCGSLVGSVVAAAVIFYPSVTQAYLIDGLADSKTLSQKQRLYAYRNILKHSLDWSIGRANVPEIDYLNILKARLLAMKRAVYNLSITPDLILIDGNQTPEFKNISYQCFVKGDSRIPVISAASVIAKVIRDHDMLLLDAQYPKYGLSQNKGYPTNFHLKQLKLYGPTLCHRKSFAPMKYMK